MEQRLQIIMKLHICKILGQGELYGKLIRDS